MRWTAVVPVKRLALAKTRLHVPDVEREDIALAFALDTVAALRLSQRITGIIVVTDDRRARSAFDEIYGHHVAGSPVPSQAPVHVVPDVPDAGLNTALEHGARTARTLTPDSAVVAVSADLPALRGEDVDEAVNAAGMIAGPSFLADVSGVGTTMLFAPTGHALVPDFGPRSRAGHRASGAIELLLDARSARRDVDTAVDLWDAQRLGLGPATTALLAQTASSQSAQPKQTGP